jgi:hypothetical protein
MSHPKEEPLRILRPTFPDPIGAEGRVAQERGVYLACVRYFAGTASGSFVKCTTPCPSVQR